MTHVTAHQLFEGQGASSSDEILFNKSNRDDLISSDHPNASEDFADLGTAYALDSLAFLRRAVGIFAAF